MTPDDFLREVAGPQRRPLYLVSGGEPSALARCLAAAEEAVAPDFRDFNFQVLDLNSGEAPRLIGEASTMPFFVSPRLLLLKNPPFSGDDWNILLNYLENPNPESTIVLVLDKPDKRLKFFKKVTTMGLEVDCTPPQGRGSGEMAEQ